MWVLIFGSSGFPSNIPELIELAKWASKRENWWDLEAKIEEKVPGFDTRYIRILDFFGLIQCTFSWTYVRSEQNVYRQLTLSVRDPTKVPHPRVGCHIAKELGFTGEPMEWTIFESQGKGLDGTPHRNVVIVQLVWPVLYIT